MSSSYELTFNDNTLGAGGVPEKGKMRVHIVDLTAANIVATQALLATLLSATEALSLGVLNREIIVLSNTLSSQAPADSNLAQRENKFLVRFSDNVTSRIYKTEIPCAKLSLLSNNSEFLDLSTGVGGAFKAAFDAVVKSPDNNAVTVGSVQFVGRSS